MKSVEKKHRRFLAAILTLCLLLGLCPLTPSAQAEETTATVAGSTTRENAQNVPIGESVTTTLNDGNNYYAIPSVKAGQQVHVSLDRSYTGVTPWIYSADGKAWGNNRADVCTTIVEESGTYYLSLFARNAQTPMEIIFFVTLYDNDKYEPNDSIETATQIQSGQSIDFTLLCGDSDYFAITTTKQSQFISVQAKSAERFFVDIYDSTGAKVGSDQINTSRSTVVFCTSDIGTYYLRLSYYGNNSLQPTTASFVSTLIDNDTNEPNDTNAAATELHDGESAEFTLAGDDVDYFKVTTTAPGQDIALTVSGYNYANRGETFSLYLDPVGALSDYKPSCAAYAKIDANGTLYLHAAAAGEHYIALQRHVNVVEPICLTRTLSVEILDGDQNEPNDTKDAATRLTLGTDETFMVGGFGDEDWFWFEAAPDAEEKKLYTLSFLDLNTDYSDEFFYEVYAPDGTAVKTGTQVNIRHVSTFSCDQQGQYKVRIYTTANNSKDYYDRDWDRTSMDYARSTLRICVSEGGDDPYESNDTWQTAANVPAGNIQHVLASTADEDWFCFNVPEDDMTLHLTSTKRTNAALYRAGDLMEQGDRADALFDWNTNLYYKLTDAGVYYIRLTANSSYVSPDIRTTGIELLPATDEENNDTWKKATPLYEGAPRSFELSADNDVDWFKFVVPEDGARVEIRTAAESRYSHYLYRGQDFLAAGDNAAYIDDWYAAYTFKILTLEAGTYYLRESNDRAENCSVTYRILPPPEENVSIETAKQLAPGEWAEYYKNVVSDNSEYRCFCIGERRAGEIVRVSRDAAGRSCYVSLLDAAGKTVNSDNYANQIFRIPADGSYYLRAEVQWKSDDNGRQRPNRLRYDIGSGEEKVSAIESADSLTLLEGEKMFLDLRCAPYGASSTGNRETFYVNTPSCVYYDIYTGYLTANSVGTGTLTVSLYGNSDVKKEIPVTVLAKDSLKALGVSIANVPGTLALGTSADLTAAYTLDGSVVLTNPEKAVTWTISDPKVLYVAQGGRVVAVGGGTATVTASVGGVSEESAPITVTAAAETPQETVSSIKLNKYSLTLYVGETGEQLAASILPEGSTARVTWASSNTKAAAVSSDGVVTPIAPGMSTITAEAGGRHVSATVTVLAARVRVSGVSFDETEHKIPVRGTAKLTATIAPADATVKTLVWTSDDSGIASVSRTGIVTAVSVGTTKIHATSVDGNHSAEITVTVTPSAELGDVNGDGYIDSADAMLCLRYSVGLKELTEEQKRAANVNHDSFIDAGDAIKILRYDAKLIDSLN